MILVDTSVWVDYFRDERNQQADELDRLIRTGRGICTCGIVLAETLAGVHSDLQAKEILDLFNRWPMLPIEQPTYVSAADLFRSARKSGRSVRRIADCLIAACAIAHSTPILHRDRDFDSLSSISNLKIFSIG